MIIIHGDNLVQSREFLSELIKKEKGKGKEIIRFEGKEIDFEKLHRALEDDWLLGKQKFVIIENFFSKNSNKEIISYLAKKQPKNLVIWEEKELKKEQINKLNARLRLFKQPAIVFKFLDSVFPGNYRQSLNLLQLAIRQSSPENVFYMLIRQFRYLIIACDLGQKGIFDLHPYQQHKIISQAKKFKIAQLLNFHQKLLFIDWQQKTGQTPMSLESQLDLLIASL